MYQGAIYTAMVFWGVVYAVVVWGFSTLQPHVAMAEMVEGYYYDYVKVSEHRKENNYSPVIDRKLVVSAKKYNDGYHIDMLSRMYVGVNRSTGEYAWPGYPESWDDTVITAYRLASDVEDPAKKIWAGFCILCFLFSGVAIVRAREDAGMNPFMD